MLRTVLCRSCASSIPRVLKPAGRGNIQDEKPLEPETEFPRRLNTGIYVSEKVSSRRLVNNSPYAQLTVSQTTDDSVLGTAMPPQDHLLRGGELVAW